MKKVLVLENLIMQTKDRNLSPNLREQIYKVFGVLSNLESEDASIKRYLLNKNGKEMKGTEHIFKFQLNSGDRILYTWGKYLPYIREENALVLIAWATHEEQGEVAKQFCFSNKRSYQYASDIVKELKSLGLGEEGFTEQDLLTVAELISEPDYSKWHATYVMTPEEYSELDSEEMEIYLSDEQDKIITEFFEAPAPMMIYGGAGTGKTLIAIHILNDFQLSNPEKQAAYFTQSFELREKSRKIFDNISKESESPNIHFYDINEYCMEILGLERSLFVGAQQFVGFVESRKDLMEICRKNEISPIDAWTEIRGTIKGSMSADWTHTKEFLQQEEFGNIEKLVTSGILTRSKSDKKKFKLTSEANTIIGENPELLKNDALKKIRMYFSSFDSGKIKLTKDEYFALTEEQSTLSKDKREAIWEICSAYESNRIATNQFDDNDLIREMYKKPLSTFDLVVVDEIQDYTELQIFFLFSIASDKLKIAFVGDNHQNINPTYFNISKINTLFIKSNVKLKQKPLKLNFRCQQEIINRTNELAELRRVTIASTSSETECPETSQKGNGTLPMRLHFNQENLRAILDEVIKYPGVAVLVPNEATKQMAIDCIGREKYKSQGIRFIYSVSEIKGMEYTYVVALNLIDQFIDIWNMMLSTSKAKRQTKYRYYFNLLYVAMTRAQNHLCFIDERLNDKLEKILSFQNQESFNAKSMHFTELIRTESSWLAFAKECETNGLYSDAIAAYERGKAEIVNIHRCKMLLYDNDRDYESAMKYCLLSNSQQYCERIYKEIQSGLIKNLGELYLSLIKGEYPQNGDGPSILVDEVYDDQVEKSIAFNNLISLYRKAISSSSKELLGLMEGPNGY